MKPLKINKSTDGQLVIIWDDGYETRYKIDYLRNQCPCASCQGETVLFHTHKPVKSDTALPGKYELNKIEQVGNYAIQIIWKDGHDSGIYSWEYLRKICQCNNTKNN
jgi:DUF971 family protein